MQTPLSPQENSRRILYYKRPEIQQAIVEAAQDKEIAVRYGDRGFGKRPDVLKFPRDVLQFVLKGATSFHASEELWYNPLALTPDLKQKELDELRKGWDLVIDIDCVFLEYSKIAAYLIIQELKNHGIKSISCKFSGNHGFHIGVPFEAFPKVIAGENSRFGFPKIPKRVALYLKDRIQKKLSEKILEFENSDISNIMKKTGKSYEELVEKISPTELRFKVDKILEIDTILISSRHMYRMPYSFNEKSGLISIPINPEDVLLFDKSLAEPENVKISKFKFLDRKNVIPDEAKTLFLAADDYISQMETSKQHYEDTKESMKKEKRQNFEEISEKIPEELFPPCILNIKQGMEDGKKRALFALLNFFTVLGWNYDDIKAWLKTWNKNNEEKYGEALRENLIVSQLRYHQQHNKKIMPPNCDNENYYKSIGTSLRAVCQPDNFCKYIKNPAQYAMKKAHFIKQNSVSKKKSQKKTKKLKKTD